MGNQSSQQNQSVEETQSVVSNESHVQRRFIRGLSNSGTERPAEVRDVKKIKVEDFQEEQLMRQPIPCYPSINDGEPILFPANDETEALLYRYRYYTRLAPHHESQLLMPDHVVPDNFLIRIQLPKKGKQSSLVTIFALWNTMMGTSLLSMPWAVKQAGFVCGIAILAVMAGIMGYTSFRVLTSVNHILGKKLFEFSDVCKHFGGIYAEIVAVVCSFLTLLGSMIVYWILMSNFLYHIVLFIYTHVGNHQNISTVTHNTSHFSDVICKDMENGTVMTDLNGAFEHFWDEKKTVPIFLICILAPLINFRSPTFFTKFNSFGTISVLYLCVFVAVKSSHWGINIHLGTETQISTKDPSYTPIFRWTFPALTGVSALAYFVQNCVLAVTRNHKAPENATRDLIIAYILVSLTYIYMGVMFCTSFPIDKSCIEENFLNNISSSDILAFVARIGLFFQMMCVFPLLVYVLRAQFMHTIFGSQWPSLKHVLLLNLFLIGICLVFAIFMPHIGKIISFVGAFCGLTYAIALPCIVYMAACRLNGTLTWPKVIGHSILIALGLANFVAQFIII